jgi:hypothetical protein
LCFFLASPSLESPEIKPSCSSAPPGPSLLTKNAQHSPWPFAGDEGDTAGQQQIMCIITWFGGKSRASSSPHSDHLAPCMQQGSLTYLNLNLNSESVDTCLSKSALEKCRHAHGTSQARHFDSGP